MDRLQKIDLAFRRWFSRIRWKIRAQIRGTWMPIHSHRHLEAELLKVRKEERAAHARDLARERARFDRLYREWQNYICPAPDYDPMAVFVDGPMSPKELHFDWPPPPERWTRDLVVRVEVASHMLNLAPLGDQREWFIDVLRDYALQQVFRKLSHTHIPQNGPTTSPPPRNRAPSRGCAARRPDPVSRKPDGLRPPP